MTIHRHIQDYLAGTITLGELDDLAYDEEEVFRSEVAPEFEVEILIAKYRQNKIALPELRRALQDMLSRPIGPQRA